MSIFPKMITLDESVIIHIRIKNYDDIVKYLQLRTYIEDPSGKIVKKFNKDFILNINSENNEYKDFYFEFKPKKKSKIGKYLAKTNLYYKGEVLHSLTIEDDYFYIEKLDINATNYKETNTIYIKNLSNEEVLFDITLLDGAKKEKETYRLNGHENKKLILSFNKYKEVYIKYGNNFCKRISEKNEVFYLRNNKYTWECIDDKLLLLKDNKKILLNNIDAYIWLSCDGVTSFLDIVNETKIKQKKVKRVLKKLKRKKLIILVKN